MPDVVREVEAVVAEGMTEVVLLGQTVNSYHDGEFDFADLLRAVGAVDGVRRIRFTSPHPNDFSDRVIAAMAEVDAVCEHVHLPMQSGSTRVLKRMLRRYTREGYLDCVAKLRAAVPGLSLTTDVIVGFPGETDEDFEETLEVVREVGFADGFTFKFSPRDGTPATRMPAELTVSDELASERLARLVETIRGISRATNMTQLGRRYEVLIERAGATRRRRVHGAHARLQDGDGTGRRDACSAVPDRRAHWDDRVDVHRANRRRAEAAAVGGLTAPRRSFAPGCDEPDE